MGNIFDELAKKPSGNIFADMAADNYTPVGQPPPLEAYADRSVRLPGTPNRVPMVDHRRAATNPIEFGQNFYQDMTDTLGGMGVMGSGLKNRLYDAIHPDALFDPNIAPMDKLGRAGKGAMEFLVGAGIYGPNKDWGTKGLFQAQDAGMALQMGDAAFQGLHDTYIDPIYSGQPQRIVDHALKHPFNTFTDLLPMAGAAGNIGKAANQIPAVSRATQAVNQGAQAIKASPLVANAVKNVTQAAESIPLIQRYTPAGNAIRDAISKANAEYVNRLQRDMQWVEEAWNKVPKDMRDRVLDAGEMRNLKDFNDLSKVNEVREFWNRVNQVNSHLGKRLEDAGALSAEDRLTAQYGPFVRATTGKDEKWLSTPAGQAAIKHAKQKLDAQGVAPTYMGIMTDPQVRNALKLRGNMFAEGPDVKIENVARDVASPASPVPPAVQPAKPGFANKRVIGERVPGKSNTNPFELTAARYAQGLQYLHMKEFFQEMLNNPTIQKAGAATDQALDVHEFFKGVAKQAGMSDQVVQAAIKDLPQFAYLPTSVTNALKNALPKGGRMNNAVATVLGPSSNIFKTSTLGFDAMFVAMQGLQTAMVAQVMMNRGLHPREFAATMMAYMMAFDKNVRDKLPKNWFDGLAESEKIRGGVTTLSPGLLQTGSEMAARAVGYIPNKVFGTMSNVENYFRATAGIYKLLKEVDSVQGPGKQMLKDAFDYMKQVDNIEAALADPKKAAAAQVFVEKWMGKYDALTSAQQRGMKAVLPFWLWMMHATSMTKAVATETPWKAAMMGRIANAAPELLQNDPNMPQRMKDLHGVPTGRTGPNGRPLYMLGANMTPFTTALETVQQGVDLLAGGKSPEREGLPAVNPMILFLAGWLYKTNPQTGEHWNNPNLTHSKGNQYLPGARQQVQEVQQPSPNAVQQLVRSHMPRQEDAFRTGLAYPYKPSDFTGLSPDFTSLEAAPARKTVKMRATPQKNFDAAEILFNTATKLKPTEASSTPKEERVMSKLEKASVRRSEKVQRRSKHDPTWIEKMLTGE